MKQKQKIIIGITSLLCGSPIIFLAFRDHKQEKKKNNQQLIKQNNQHFSKQKKKKSSVLQIILIIILIVIFVFIIFLIVKRRKKPNLDNGIKNTLDNEIDDYCLGDLEKYLSGRLHATAQQDAIIICFSPYALPKESEISDQLFNLDIHKDEKDIHPELQDIYKYLNEHEQWLKDFGKAIGEFFNLLDGNLLKAVYQEKNKDYETINEIYACIKDSITKKGFIKGEIGIRYVIDVIDYKIQLKQTVRQENETAFDFFSKIIDENYSFRTKDGQTIIIFEHYQLLLALFGKLSRELINFFDEHENYKNQYQDNFEKAIEKIKYFLTHDPKNKKNCSSFCCLM